MRHGRFWLAPAVLLASAVALWTLAQPPAPPAPAADEEPAPDEARELAVIKRFRDVLEKNPRRGTALDRLYGFHVERGTLDKLIGEYQERTRKDPKDGVAWMVIGLLESQRGRDAAAVEAFRQAEANLPDNAIPGYYLGLSLVLVGQPDAAAEAFERAITKKPNRTDLLDVFQALGRVYQRGQRTDKALDVWNRLEKLFPDDARVQEQIATTLIEEGQYDQAAPRLEKLIQATKDDKYRQATLRMDLAELKVKLKKTPEALADFEKLLGELNPDNWLHRDVRRRVEDVFLRNDDLAGLAKYYEKWLEKNPTDVDAIARLAKNLASQGRSPEAKKWLEKGLEVAPTARSLRAALIDQYVFEQNYAAAAGQYEAMEKADPGNPDVLREWGKLILKDTTRPEPERKAAAVAVWKRILEKKPTDPVPTAQVADLMRGAGVADEAIALYKKAIELAPANAQYREYLGEYYHSLKRSGEALATWRPIAEGPNRNAKNLTRLAEVFAGFGYRKEAIAAMADAITLEANDFPMLMTYAELLHSDGQNDPALQQLDAAQKLVSSPEEAEQVLVAQIKVYTATEKLGDRIDDLRKELDGGKDATADRYHRLARYYEANRQADEAMAAIVKAAEKDPKSVPILSSAARIYESGGNLLAAADANRKLAAIDRRFRTEYLQAVAKLEQRLGRREQALQAGRDLLAASPGNPDTYKFYADLCFQLGDADEGLEALRRSVRANPSDPQGLITLANAMVERLRQGEAIELLWRAFDKTTEMEGRLSIIDRLAQLYLENNQFDRLVERLERERREAEKNREMSMCLAQAYQTAGDLGTARQQLERLLTENTRDVNLLGQLSALCEQENDVAAAVKYQRQLTSAAPNNVDHQLRLAQLLTKAGEADEAADIWVKLATADPEPHRNLQSIDQLVTAGKPEAALALLTRLIAQKPGDWELLYREGAILAKTKPDEAAARFKAILALRLPDDEEGAKQKHERAQAGKKKGVQATQQAATRRVSYVPGMAGFSSGSFRPDTYPPLLTRTGNVWTIRQATGLDSREYYGGYPGGQQQNFYAPSDFGEARMACYGWLLAFAQKQEKQPALVKEVKAAGTKPNADPRAVWDWYYLQMLRHDHKGLADTARALAAGNDPAGLLAYLGALPMRTQEQGPGGRRYTRRGGTPDDGTDKVPPLPPEQLAQLLGLYAKLKQQKPDWVTSDTTQMVMTELKRAKRADEEQKLYREMMDAAKTADKVQAVFGIAVERNDLGTALALFERLDKLQGPPKNAAALSQLPTRQASYQLSTLMGKRADDKNFADVLKVLDLGLGTARRQNLAAAKGGSTKKWSSGGMHVNVYAKSQHHRGSTHLQFPSPNDYYDEATVGLLYNAFDLYKKADVLSDLFAHFKKQADAAQGQEKLYFHLALGYLHWWNDEKEEALAQLTAATRAAPADLNLLMEVAGLREQNNEPDAALAMLDSVTPLDAQMMQRREQTALRLAEKLGNIDRARQAAERLFGLRLDSETQLDLAGKMHRLGMHELAETVLNRAQRQAGSKTSALLRLMAQYQSQNQPELAVQIARQILRKSPSARGFNPYGGYDEGDNARNQAVAVLSRSGQLKEMVERAEAQLKASPKSLQVLQTLMEYYKVTGEKKKVKDVALRIAELKPDDAKARYQLAQQLQQLGETDAAIEQYKIAIKKEPELFSYRYWEIQELFTRANKYEELVQIFDQMDLRRFNRYWTVIEMIQPLLQQEKTKDLGLKLFRKAWAALPEYRAYMIGNLYEDRVWQMPEIYDFAKQALLPRLDADPDAVDAEAFDPWAAATSIVSYSGEGRVDGVVTRLLSIARKQQRLPELRAEIEGLLKKKPDWIAGRAIAAVIDVQTGQKERGRKTLEEIFKDKNADVPPLARFVLAQELEYYAGMDSLALKLLEDGIEDLLEDGQYEFSYSPARRLVWWYNQLGRTADAKKLMMRALKMGRDPGYGGGYWQYRKIQNAVSVANELIQKGDAVEAVRIYNELMADRESLNQANQYYGGERFDKQVESGLRQAVRSLKPQHLPAAVGALLTPRPVTPTNRTALDLILLVESRDLTKASMTSMFATAIKSTEKNPEVRKEAVAKAADLAAKHPKDFSVQVAAALVALADGKPEATAAAVDRLSKLAEATPLEALPPNGKANSRQRAEAIDQVPVWLVARECVKDPKLRPAGYALGARALEAAKRQLDPVYATAILREWGQAALDAGDRPTAEAKWGEMLELVLPKPSARRAAAAPTPAPPGAAPVPVAPTPASPPPPSDDDADDEAEGLAADDPEADEGSVLALLAQTQAIQVKLAGAPPARGGVAVGVPVLSAEQFDQAVQIANLAADRGMPALSLKAMKDAVRGGPPTPNPNRGRRYWIRSVSGAYEEVVEGGSGDVYGAVNGLVPKWRKLKVPPAETYAVAVAAVLPDARPAEVFAGIGNWTGGSPPRGLGHLLAEIAVEAGTVEDLRAKLEARTKQPLGELPARVMLVVLARQAKDDERLSAAIKALGDRIQKDTSQGTQDQVVGAVLPSLDSPALAPAVLPVLEKAAQNYAVANNAYRSEQVRYRLAGYHLGRKDEAAAREQYKKVSELAAKGNPDNSGGISERLAVQYLKAGWLDDALRELGVSADVAANAAGPRKPGAVRGGGGSEPQINEFPRLVRLLMQLPAEKRYESLRAWSMPTGARKSVRYVVGLVPLHIPPAAFGGFANMPANEHVSTLTLMIDAAKEAGKAAELTAEADKLAAENVENADLLRVLAYLMQGKGKEIEPAVKAFSEAAHKRLTTVPEQPTGPRYYGGTGQQAAVIFPSELQFIKLCLADPALVPHGERLLPPVLQKAQNSQNADYLYRIRSMWDRLGATRAGAPDALLNGLPPRWYSATHRSVWFAQDNYLVQGWNDQPSYLTADVPLAGTFEFTVDAYQGVWTEGHVGYGGLVCEPNRPGVDSSVWPIGLPQQDRVSKVAPALKNDGFNTITVRVSPEKVTYLVNGQVFYEDTKPPPTSPWVMLYAGGGRRPVFRNFALTGKPEVLPEVKLVAGDYLDGWTNHVYGGTRPPRLRPKEIEKKKDDQSASGVVSGPGGVAFIAPPAVAGTSEEKPKEPEYDWWAKDGVLHGRRVPSATRPLPAKLMYFRPLRPGEEVRYEFFYQPGDTHCHPSLGRLAFLLEADGVKLHFLTDRADDDWTGLKADNAVTEPDARRGPEKLPLKAGDWNAVKLSTTADAVRIELNGVLVYERKLEPLLERLFGVYHDRAQTGVRVRNAVLAGDWPKAVNPAEVNFATKPASAAEARARRWQLGERFYFSEAGDVVKKAATLPAAEAYRVLADWVLPNESRPSFQLAGERTAQDVLGVVNRPDQPPGRRVLLGSRFDAPALALVAAAKEAGKLDELADRVAKVEPGGGDELGRRGRAALLAVVRAAQGNDAEAGKLLRGLVPFVKKMAADAHGPERWPDLIAVLGTIDRPGLLADATAVMDAVSENIQQAMMQNKMSQADREWWVRTYRAVRGKVRVLAHPEAVRRPYGADAGFVYWDSTPDINSWTRSQGMNVPHWVYKDGVLTHHPGHNEDYLAFRVPLRGEFEVTADLKLQGWQEAHLMYGGRRIDLSHDRKQVVVIENVRHTQRRLTVNPPFPPKLPTTYAYKLALKEGVLTASVDGRVVHAERVGLNSDPWLLLHSTHQCTGEVRNLKIAGTPTVPHAIELTADEALAAWRPYLGQPWSKRGEEMFHGGKRPQPGVDYPEGQPAPPRGQPENAIFYHRPLLEDGVVDYEFYVDPGKCMVHPTLDRLVFLLEEDGVKLHWLTDGPHERSGVPLDNVVDEPKNRRGPSKLQLKPHAWNTARLEVAGDVVKVSLNGELVYERPIEPTNQRYFGLFHYTDRTEARVRAVTMRGAWPKAVPPAEKLFEVRK